MFAAGGDLGLVRAELGCGVASTLRFDISTTREILARFDAGVEINSWAKSDGRPFVASQMCLGSKSMLDLDKLSSRDGTALLGGELSVAGGGGESSMLFGEGGDWPGGAPCEFDGIPRIGFAPGLLNCSMKTTSCACATGSRVSGGTRGVSVLTFRGLDDESSRAGISSISCAARWAMAMAPGPGPVTPVRCATVLGLPDAPSPLEASFVSPFPPSAILVFRPSDAEKRSFLFHAS